MIILDNKTKFKKTVENFYKTPVSSVEKLRNKFLLIANHKIERFFPREGINGIKDVKNFEKDYIEFDENGEIIELKQKFLKEYEESIKEFFNDDSLQKRKLSKLMIYTYLLPYRKLYILSNLIGDTKSLTNISNRRNRPLNYLTTLKKLITEREVRRTQEIETIENIRKSYIEEMKEYDLNYIYTDCINDIRTSKTLPEEDKDTYVEFFNRVWNIFLEKK